MTSRADTADQQLLDAATTLVAAAGLRGLSLRPLAETLETTVSALTHRFGLKDALVTRVIEAACAQDDLFFDRWLARIRALGACDDALMADLAEAIVADMTGPEAPRNRLYCELLQGLPSRPEIVGPLAAWSERRLAFWRVATEASGRPELGDILHAFSTDEVAHGLAIGDLAAYRWLRRLNLNRLCGGLLQAAHSSDLREFGVFRTAMADVPGAPGRYQAPTMTAWQAKAARHISALIVAEGADAVTHRAVASRTGVPNSTLAYHFPRQEDLLKAGINDIIVRAQGETDAPVTSEPDYTMSSVEIARSTFAVALVAARIPDLRGFVADMRRRRGENYLIRISRDTIGGSSFDLLSAQAIAMTAIGRLILDAAMDATQAGDALALAERMQAAALADR